MPRSRDRHDYDPQLEQLLLLPDPLDRDALSLAHPAASETSNNKTPMYVSLTALGIARLLSARWGRSKRYAEPSPAGRSPTVRLEPVMDEDSVITI